jgi:Flp pilus assembly protein TadG
MAVVRLRIPGLEFDRGVRGREFMMDLFGGMIPARRASGASDMFSRLARAESEEGERYADAEIARAYRRAGSVKGAAKLLGCARATVRLHLDRAARAQGVADPAPANDDGAELARAEGE